VCVGDVAEAVVKAVGFPSTRGKVYELGGPRVYRYRELVELVLVHLNRRRFWSRFRSLSGRSKRSFSRSCRTHPLTGDQVMLMRRDNIVSDTALTFADFGITPRTVEAELPSILV
jgi:nucleoside-diphosphate-sugar epimerase